MSDEDDKNHEYPEPTEHEYCGICNEGLEDGSEMDFLGALDDRLLNERTIMLNGDIDEVLNGRVTRSLQLLTRDVIMPTRPIDYGDPARTEIPNPEITLLISSHGGSADACYAIVHAIQEAQARGYTVIGEVRGYAMSAAAMILQHCDVRLAGTDDIIMVHGPQNITIGDVRNQEADLKLTHKMIDSWVKFFAERTTSSDDKYRTEEFWRALFRDQIPHYFVGEEALTAGLVDLLV